VNGYLLIVILVIMYMVLVLAGGCLSLIIVNPKDGMDFPEEMEDDNSDFHLALMNAATCIITMGAGNYGPTNAEQYWVNSILQIMGVVWNVLIFSVVVTRFQHPEHEILFSEIACTLTRDGVNLLLIRIGNKRGNYVFEPNVLLFVVSKQHTLEGESFIQSTPVNIRNAPPVISGTFNIIAEIEPGSQLDQIVLNAAGALDEDDYHGVEQEYSLLVMMSGFDDTYQAEVRAFHRYQPHQIKVNRQFQDCITTDLLGQPSVNWQAFHLSKPLETIYDKPIYWLEGGDVPQPSMKPERSLHLFAQGSTIDKGGELHIVGSYCPFTVGVEMIMMELKIPYVLHVMKADNKPKWFSSKFKNAVVPAIYWNGEFMQESTDIVEKVMTLNPVQSAKLKNRNSLLPPGFTAEYCMKLSWDFLNHDAYDENSNTALIIGATLTTSASSADIPIGMSPPSYSSSPGIRGRSASLVSPSLLGGVNIAMNSPQGPLKESQENNDQLNIHDSAVSKKLSNSSTKYTTALQGAAKNRAIHAALDELIEKIKPLEKHLVDYPYCCGKSVGIEDFRRFCLLQDLWLILAPIWGYDKLFFARAPGIHRWMLRMKKRKSYPFNIDNGAHHSPVEFLLAFGVSYRSRMSNRYFPGMCFSSPTWTLTCEQTNYHTLSYTPSILLTLFSSPFDWFE
jgi:inward rectifier potassium channel